MLHATPLGHFLGVCDTFFHKVGPATVPAKRLNTLASEFGRLLSHQSDRDMPKTKFSAGIRKGKLMAKEHTEITLVVLITIKSPRGQETTKHRNTHFQNPQIVTNWIMFLETCLQWIEWLQSTKMPLKDVDVGLTSNSESYID